MILLDLVLTNVFFSQEDNMGTFSKYPLYGLGFYFSVCLGMVLK